MVRARLQSALQHIMATTRQPDCCAGPRAEQSRSVTMVPLAYAAQIHEIGPQQPTRSAARVGANYATVWPATMAGHARGAWQTRVALRRVFGRQVKPGRLLNSGDSLGRHAFACYQAILGRCRLCVPWQPSTCIGCAATFRIPCRM